MCRQSESAIVGYHRSNAIFHRPPNRPYFCCLGAVFGIPLPVVCSWGRRKKNAIVDGSLAFARLRTDCMVVKYKVVIFDFDGTLADTFPWFAGVINEVAQRYHFKHIEPDEYETMRGLDAHGVLKYLSVPLWKMPLIANCMRSLMTRDIDQIVLFDGIDEVLRRLSHSGTMLAVVSSNSHENICRVLGSELAASIAHYECGVSMFGKETKLRKILKRSGVTPDEAIYIGDEIRDSQAARKVGLAFGGASWGYTTKESLLAHAPSDVLDGVDDILDRLTVPAPTDSARV